MNCEKDSADLHKILDFHAHFEQIRSFEDYNGRVDRMIMMKKCLRYGINPFIIDDKRRSAYHRGIAVWDSLRSNTYLASFGRNETYKEVAQKHYQKAHMRLSGNAKEYIDSRLSELEEKYGVKEYTSEL